MFHIWFSFVCMCTGFTRYIMRVSKGCIYNVVLILLLVLLHVGVFYYESKADANEAIWGSLCWFMIFVLFIINLILNHHDSDQDGFWCFYNSTMIIILIVINAIGIAFGYLKEADGASHVYAIVEACAVVTQDILFLWHIYAAATQYEWDSCHVERATIYCNVFTIKRRVTQKISNNIHGALYNLHSAIVFLFCFFIQMTPWDIL